MYGGSIHRQAKGIDGVRAHQKGVAKCIGLTKIVVTRAHRIQYVVGLETVGSWNLDEAVDQPSKHGLPAAQLVVDLGYGLMVVFYIPGAVRQNAARIRRLGKFVRNVTCGRTEQRRIEPVVNERGPERKLPARVAGG